ncbi:MAG: AEC family transporter [Clostridia bacterium]|nr:AEC family transporter [Clostridia bacterium]
MFVTVLTQVVILFILIFVGFILTKIKMLNDQSVKSLTDLALTLVTACVIVKSFFREFNKSDLKDLLLSFLLGIILHTAFILLTLLFLKDKDKNRQAVLHYAAVFSNCGFMALPLQEALLGDDGVFLCSSFVAIFNAFVWSWGIRIMSGDKKSLKPLKILTRPAILALIIGFIIFIFSIPVPNIISQPISMLAALNTPLPMIIIGYHLASSNVLKGFSDIKCLLTILLRLIVFPAVAILGMWLCGVKGNMLISQAICCAAPVAANTTMFSAKYGRDTELSVNLVSLSTLLSLITMPIMITLTEKLATL